ncbi:hypothetical protein OKC48_13675 [Methylorubrum extorquens]|uniref:hypothetical protein n=1 Tax=Methylorubrum extorquens TaxID=408 RepID=UPI002237B90F|nr:hypothetical protein [Methylorubrum extorquens]UYW29505.1 hypothetical protein OKC48_13675 [Methylorubrum extorquens]
MLDAVYGQQIERYYLRLREMGLVRSRRDYGRRWLRRASTYMHDLRGKKREWALVRPDTTAHLRERLTAVADLLPPGLAAEVRAVVSDIDRDVTVVGLLRSGR